MKNRYWSKEEKIRIIKRNTEGFEGICKIAKDEEISAGMLHRWIKKYLEYGEESLENHKKPGNPLSKYQNKKNLSEIEKLEYENMKLRIENERLKKGYMMKGDGTYVIYK